MFVDGEVIVNPDDLDPGDKVRLISKEAVTFNGVYYPGQSTEVLGVTPGPYPYTKDFHIIRVEKAVKTPDCWPPVNGDVWVAGNIVKHYFHYLNGKMICSDSSHAEETPESLLRKFGVNVRLNYRQ